jgi:DNA-binding response OmpR family regulator
MKILLAEDDHNVAVIMRLCLERMGGHEVVHAEDGEVAITYAKSETFDLILLDGMMPKKNGLIVAQELRATGLTTPMIFLTAKSDEPAYQQLGAGYIAKPFEPTLICSRIDEIMAQVKARLGVS